MAGDSASINMRQNADGVWEVDQAVVTARELIRQADLSVREVISLRHAAAIDRIGAVDGKLEQYDRRYEERFQASQTALKEALASAEKLVAAALAAADRAVSKAELATDKRFESVNEFRSTLADQQRLFIPRAETDILFRGLSDRLDTQVKTQAERLGIIDSAVQSRVTNSENTVVVTRISDLDKAVTERLTALAKVHTDRDDTLQKQISELTGAKTGSKDQTAYIVAGFSMVIAVIAIIGFLSHLAPVVSP